MLSHLSHLLNLDLLAPSVQLRIAGNTSSKSLVGVVLFLGYVGISIWTCFLQFLDFRDTTKPSIQTSNLFSVDYPVFDLKKENSLPIVMGTIDGVKFVNPTELQAYMTLKLWVTRFELNTTTGEYITTVTEPPVVPCKQLLDSGELSRDFMKDMPPSYLEIIPEYGMCANTTGFDVTVVGSNTDSLQLNVDYSISPCSLPGGVGCKPAVEVNRMFIQTLNPHIALNLTSQLDPVVTVYSPDDLFPLNVNNLQLFKYEMVRNEIKDSFGFLSNQQARASFATVITKTPQLLRRDPSIISADEKDLFYFTTQPYAVISWVSGTKFNLIRRNYQGIIDLVSNIGGLNSLILAVATTLYSIVHRFFEKKLLVLKIFGVTTSAHTWLTTCLKKKASNRIAAKADSVGDATRPAESGASQHITSNSPYTIVSKEVFEEAFKVIENDLDVVNICKQLHELRILMDLLLKKDQTELIPLATLCRHNSIKRQASRLKTEKSVETDRIKALRVQESRKSSKILDENQGVRNILNAPKESVVDPSSSAFGPGSGIPQREMNSMQVPLAGSVGNKTTYHVMVEGLEEEFNKLIRTELVGEANLQASSVPNIQNLLQAVLRGPLDANPEYEPQDKKKQATDLRSSESIFFGLDEAYSVRATPRAVTGQLPPVAFEAQHSEEPELGSSNKPQARQQGHPIPPMSVGTVVPSITIKPRTLKLGEKSILQAKQP